MARRDRKNKNSNVVKVDFTDTESNVLLPEVSGATLKVLAATHKDNDGDGAIVVKYEVVKADSKKLIGKTGIVYFNLGETSLWVLRNFLEAVGVEVPAGPMDIDLTELPELEFVADITQNEYNGRTSNRLANFSMTDGDSKKDEEDEDEVIVKGKKRPKDEDDEEDEAPRKKSKKVVDEDEDEDEAPKSKKKSSKSDDEDEEEEKPRKKSKKIDDEDEEDEAPKKKKKKAVITEDEVRDMDEKELKGLIREHELDVDLAEYPNIRKKGMAVIDALSDAGLLDAE